MNPIAMSVTGREQMVLAYQQHSFVAVSLGITLAQLNAGYNIIGTNHNRQIRVHDFFIRVNGATIGAVTDIRIGTTASTPVVIATIAQAVATIGSKHTPQGGLDGTTVSAVTLGAGFAVKLAQSNGVKLYKTGSDATGAFTVDVILRYDIVG